jgi:hypothetical protein
MCFNYRLDDFKHWCGSKFIPCNKWSESLIDIKDYHISSNCFLKDYELKRTSITINIYTLLLLHSNTINCLFNTVNSYKINLFNVSRLWIICYKCPTH